MANATQAGQPFRIDTTLGPDKLLLRGFEGVEAISTPYTFHVDLLSEDPNIDGAKLLRSPASLTFVLPDGSKRPIHGLIRRFAQLGRRDEFTTYRAEIVPWLWFLTLSTDLRIFQEMSVLEIVEQVFKGQGWSDFQIKCTRSYPKREYCVQYRETDFDFVSRLLEEEGIFYFFEHTDSKHTLILADGNSAAKPVPGTPAPRIAEEEQPDEDVILSLADERAVHTGVVTLTDYDYLQPSLSLQQSVAGDGREEFYDYPGNYTKPEDGDRYVRLRLEEREVHARTLTGSGTCRAFGAGGRFDLKGHYRRDLNRSYLLVEVHHSGMAGSYRGRTESQTRYTNQFTAIPSDVPFRPGPRTPKPMVRGSQTALVVGKDGEEIWVDSHGRVKVQFYWDREGKKNENSSCWVRVASSWAGKGWGWIQIPRIGQEVIVDFLEGDPDRPIITGRVYNAEQVPPYPLPANQTQSGVKSRSSKGGGTDNFNEIRLDDLRGSEKFYIHAEKDLELVVENDRAGSIGRDDSLTVGQDQTTDVSRDRKEKVGRDETITIDRDRKETVTGAESITIGGDRTEKVAGKETIKISGDRSTTLEKKETLSVGDNRSTSVDKNDSLSVSKKFSLDAGDEITLKTGSASIVLKKDGTITISGKDITLKGSGKIAVKANSDITVKGSQIKQN